MNVLDMERLWQICVFENAEIPVLVVKGGTFCETILFLYSL